MRKKNFEIRVSPYETKKVKGFHASIKTLGGLKFGVCEYEEQFRVTELSTGIAIPGSFFDTAEESVKKAQAAIDLVNKNKTYLQGIIAGSLALLGISKPSKSKRSKEMNEEFIKDILIKAKNIKVETNSEADWLRTWLYQSLERLGIEQAENDKLKEFARSVIRDVCWNLCVDDGGDIQELAEKLGLIEPFIATEKDINEFSELEVGDTIYKFTSILKG